MEVNDNVRSILEEILNKEQFQSVSEDSGENSRDESLNIFANVDLDDKSLTTNFRNTDFSLNERSLFGSNFGLPLVRQQSDVDKRLKDFEEMLAIKDSTIAALTSELDSCRELSNTNSVSIVSTTEYKQLQEECHNKLLEYNSAIIYKNDLIQQLSESLDQSVSERKELLNQIEFFKDEVAQLQTQLQETTKMVNDHKCAKDETDQVSLGVDKEISEERTEKSDPLLNLDSEFTTLAGNLDPRQKNMLNDLKIKMNEFVNQSVMKNRNLYEEEINKLKEKIVLEKDDYETEINRLRELLANIKCGSTEIMELKNELEAKHSREVEELRTYFEKKCADLEKNYSEEIFSQHSRRMSGSTCSEAELSSDLLYSHPPGPHGDIRCDLQPNITKKDLTNLKNELSSVLNKISKYNLDNITEDDFSVLKSEIGKCNLNNLLKYDLALIRSDLQNKYHAELEVLREDNENKVDVLNVEHEKRLKTLEGKYLEEIDNLRLQLDELGRQNVSISSAVQEVGSSGEFEITEVIQSYERRLQEQVTLAKIDIISALESQIQRLAAKEADDEEWPSELLQLRDRFTDKYEGEIKQLKEDHQKEVDKLKEEHMKILNGALERARRRSLKDSDSLSKGELEILKERDNLKKQVSSLRNLLGELLKYFTQCEDELNNTLVDELLKQGFDKNVSQIEDELQINDSPTSTGDSLANVTRVHLTPNFSDLINLIESNSQGESESRDISIDLKNELGVCLEKLRQEANAILALTTNMPKAGSSSTNGTPKQNSLEEKVLSMTRQLIDEAQAKDKLREELVEALGYVEALEKAKEGLEEQLGDVIARSNMLEGDLLQARSKIAELIENGHKEIVSEGYGEEGQTPQGLGDNMSILAELQEKARNMLSQSRASADPTLLHLIEELCRVGERIKEESQRDRLDLLQQVEQLEHQLQDMTKLLSEKTKKCRDVETERNEAVEKIKVLRDIIRELETQTETKSKEVEDCLQAIQKLECIVDQQHRSINELRQSDSLKDFSDIHELRRHIETLESELQQSRVNAELAGSEGALKQIKSQLFELEESLDKKTKELETLHSTGTNCSSPSEDISARDIVSKSPNMTDECEVPLQQLARLKEKLVRHSRAEDAAIKRIRDLEMQVFGLKNELEESNNEKEYMKKQIQEQLVLISDLQIRLDEQRIRAEHIEKQTNTSLELKVYDLHNEIISLREKLQAKDKALNYQQTVLNETQERLRSLEHEMSSTKEEDELLISMQKELEALRAENAQLQAKMSQESQIVPNLVENIISDKNTDIEKLRDKLHEVEKTLESYTSLSLGKRELQLLANLKHSGTSIEEVLSILDLSEAEQVRKADSRSESEVLVSSAHLAYKRNPNETVYLGNTSEPEISTIEKVGPPHVHYTIQAPLTKPNSTEIHKSLEKRVRFDDKEQVARLQDTVSTLRKELETKDNLLKEYERRLEQLNNLEGKIGKLQWALDETEKALANATKTFEQEQQELREREKNLGVELAEKKLQLSEREKRIAVLEADSVRKDEMCMNLTRDKKQLEWEKDSILQQNSLEELQSLKQELEERNRETHSLQTEQEMLYGKLEKLKRNTRVLEKKLGEANEENAKFCKELQNKAVQIDSITTEMSSLKEKLNKKRTTVRELENVIKSHEQSLGNLENEVRKQKDIIADRECEIEIANEDAKRYQNDLADLEDRIKELENNQLAKLKDKLVKDIKDKDVKIEELDKERMHLQELLGEKDKIINQITEDSHKLHVNLVTIQSKIKENGNIVDLSNKLKEEQKKTAELVAEIHDLKAQQLHHEVTRKNNPMTNSVDEITDQLKRELDYSAQIDTNIISAVSDQSLSSISESQDVEIYKKALAKEKASRKHLVSVQDRLKKQIIEMEGKCVSLQSFNEELKNVLEEERLVLHQTQVEDAKLIEQMRIQLDAVLDNEEAFGKMLEQEKVIRMQLEAELEAAKRKATSSSTSKTESTEYKALPSKEAMELSQLRKDFATLQGEKSKLVNELKSLRQAKSEIDSGYKYVKDMLNLETEKGKNLDVRIQELRQNEKELQEALLQKKIQTEQLLRQNENNKIVLEELEEEKTQLMKQKHELVQRLKTQTTAPQSATTSSSVPDVLLNKIKELNNALLDNKKLVDLIQKISNEKRRMEADLMEIKGRNASNLPFADLAARSDYLFAKTLKLESTKKALIWQKRYLLDYLQGHQRHCLVEALPQATNYGINFRTRRSPKERFKSAVFVVVSILRMKYLVRRWHSGVRIAERVNSRHYKNVPIRQENPVQTQFQVGQPVSSQLFSNNVAGHYTAMGSRNLLNLNQDDVADDAFGLDDGRISSASSAKEHAPWSGHTPPSKETRSQRRIQIGSHVLNREDMTPLKAPQLLAQFVERFDQIQEKLGVALDTNAT